jgi:hypothetical protein
MSCGCREPTVFRGTIVCSGDRFWRLAPKTMRRMESKAPSMDRRVIVSVVICASLIFIGVVRLLSYSRGVVGDVVRHSFVGFLCYDPESSINAQYFKVLATPSVVAAIYFFFRWRNGQRPRGRVSIDGLDFRSPVLRGFLTSVVTLHWLAMEWWKFHVEGFYPWSPLESRWLNIGVLVVGQVVTFWGMKYLSFGPVRQDND